MRISDWSSDVCSSDLLCPEIPFCFVEGWPMNAEERAALHARVAAHSNLRLQQRTHDMREVYRRTHTLLVPSHWEEAWGRVATEAQFSGIPVLASARRGLPGELATRKQSGRERG